MDVTSAYLAQAMAQRRLCGELLGQPDALSWRRSRDLAAHLLLHLHDSSRCWIIATDWLRDELRAERVDGGFLSEHVWYTAVAEATSSKDIPHVTSQRFDLRRAGVVPKIWLSRAPLVYRDVASDSTLDDRTRGQLLDGLTCTKVVCGISQTEGDPIIFCVDSVGRKRNWSDGDCGRIYAAVSQVIAPILTTAQKLAAPGRPADASGIEDRVASQMNRLTATERHIAELVAGGLSYKELAAKTGRSTSTIDHHLRSIRCKLGVSSTARLVRLLAS